jgi:hypothetical protein
MPYGHPIASEAGALGSGARRRVHAARPEGHRSSTTANALRPPLRRPSELGEPRIVSPCGRSCLRSRRACARRDTRCCCNCKWPRRARCAPACDQNGNPQQPEPSRTIARQPRSTPRRYPATRADAVRERRNDVLAVPARPASGARASYVEQFTARGANHQCDRLRG